MEGKKNNKQQALWNTYSEKYNKLSDKMAGAGIDVKLLRDVINARTNIDINYTKNKIDDALKSNGGFISLPILLPISALLTGITIYVPFV